MKKVSLLFSLVLVLFICSDMFSQEYVRDIVKVPKVDPAAITIDGKLDESAWTTAGKADIFTSSGSEMYANQYYREDLIEPDYDEIYARMLWAQETLYVAIHIDEIVNDSTDLFWAGKWTGDQLFVSLSNRLGIDLAGDGQYNGNIFTVPDGPYYFVILGDQLTLNGGDPSWVPEEWRRFPDDTTRVIDPYTFTRMATTIDTINGVWDLELAIYNPSVGAQSKLGFNIGGSTGSRYFHELNGDGYSYWCWQPNVPNEPYTEPSVLDMFREQGLWADPGTSNLATSQTHAVLQFIPGGDEAYVRTEVNVPQADSGAIQIDGKLDETAWQNGAKANIFTSSGSEMFANQYYREDLIEPDYDEIYANMLWAKETLYVAIHIDEIVNDSTDLFWAGKWTGDQLFVSISNRLGIDLAGDGQYNGNIFTVPDGPYYFVILGDELTLNGGDPAWVPEEWRRFPDDTTRTEDPYKFTRMGTTIDTVNGVWDLELAIYNPSVNLLSALGFNIGGSTGSRYFHELNGDGYSYWCWQPNVPNEPYTEPSVLDVFRNQGLWADPGTSSLATSQTHAVLNFLNGQVTSVKNEDPGQPESFGLYQNYPNPFNPTTTIRFNVETKGSVFLRVYNLLGQHVATLVNGENLSTGTYSAVFDAKNLSSGIYFYELKIGNQVQSKKMVLLK